MGTPSGQKLRNFYSQTDKQVREVHTEARRLADLKNGKSEAEAEPTPAAPSALPPGAAPAQGSAPGLDAPATLPAEGATAPSDQKA